MGNHRPPQVYIQTHPVYKISNHRYLWVTIGRLRRISKHTPSLYICKVTRGNHSLYLWTIFKSVGVFGYTPEAAYGYPLVPMVWYFIHKISNHRYIWVTIGRLRFISKHTLGYLWPPYTFLDIDLRCIRSHYRDIDISYLSQPYMYIDWLHLVTLHWYRMGLPMVTLHRSRYRHR
jgi:hypothetical protein